METKKDLHNENLHNENLHNENLHNENLNIITDFVYQKIDNKYVKCINRYNLMFNCKYNGKKLIEYTQRDIV